MALTRFLRKPGLHGAYTPDARQVRSISRASAKLANLPGIEPYLITLALLEELLLPGTATIASEPLLELATDLDPYFEGGMRGAIAAAWASLDDQMRFALLGGAAVEFGRELLRRLEGKPPRSTSLAIFLNLFSQVGAPLEGKLLANEALVLRIARDHFEAQITEALAKLGGTPSERLETASSVVTSFDEAMAHVLDPVSLSVVQNDRLTKIKDYLSPRRPAPRGARSTKRN
jgi:hypothetical protein